jgi:hypothetical protein
MKKSEVESLIKDASLFFTKHSWFLPPGFLLAFHEDKSLEECLRYAVASASSSLCGEGASNGIVTIEEALEKFSSDSAV